MPRTYAPVEFPDGRVVVPKSAAEAVTLRRELANARRAQEGRVSIAQKGEESRRQGLSTVNNVPTESRGQNLAERAGQTTAFADSPLQFSGFRNDQGQLDLPDYFNNLPDYNPPRTNPNATPIQNQLTKALYDLNYTKQALGVSQAQVSKVTSGVGAAQEESAVKATQNEARNRGDDLRFDFGESEVANPDFVALSENQKILNRLRKEAGESFVPETISGDSGRADIKRQLTKQEKLAAQQLSQTVGKLGDNSLEVMLENFDLLDGAQKAAARDFIQTTQAARGLALAEEQSAEVRREIKAEERLIRAQLNMSPTDELTFDADGQPLINGKTEAEDAKDRAQKDVREAKEEWLEENNKAHEEELARIRSANTVNGNITNRGLQELADAERDYEKEKKKRFEDIDERLQEFESRQNARQARVDKQIAENDSVQSRLQRKLAQDKASGAWNIQMEQAKIGNKIGFATAIKEYEKRQKVDNSKPKFAETAKALDGKIFTETFDRSTAFEVAAEEFGNNVSDAERYLKSRGFTERDVESQKMQYQQDVWGYTTEQLETKKKEKSLKQRMSLALRGELSEEDLDILETDLLTAPTKTAFQFRYAMQNPNSTPEEVEKAWRQKTATRTSSGRGGASISPVAQSVLDEFPDITAEEVRNNETVDGEGLGLTSKERNAIMPEVVRRNASKEVSEEDAEAINEVVDVAKNVSDDLAEEEKPSFWESITKRIGSFFSKKDDVRINGKRVTGKTVDDFTEEELENLSTEELEEIIKNSE